MAGLCGTADCTPGEPEGFLPAREVLTLQTESYPHSYSSSFRVPDGEAWWDSFSTFVGLMYVLS